MSYFRYEGGFRPGDAVTVVDGTFIGMPGRVISPTEAANSRQLSVDKASVFRTAKGMVWVVVEIFSRPVAVPLQPLQITWSAEAL
jgi:transcription antitermination factor NusG